MELPPTIESIYRCAYAHVEMNQLTDGRVVISLCESGPTGSRLLASKVVASWVEASRTYASVLDAVMQARRLVARWDADERDALREVAS